jgi:hypothetical protein
MEIVNGEENKMGQTPATLEEIKDYIFEQLPRVLEQDPRFVTFIEGIVAEKFPRRDEFARLLDEVQQHRQETREQFARVDQRFEQVDQRFEQVDQRFEQVDQRFEQVDQRFEQVDQRFEQVDQRFEQVDQRFDHLEQRIDGLEQRIDTGFREMHQALDRLGGRWGIRNEKVFRETMRSILEENFGVKVEERYIHGEQFDCLIFDGQHILLEIAASVRGDILARMERKRQLYIDETGITPTRFILAVGSIHSQRALALRAAGFDVIEPDE